MFEVTEEIKEKNLKRITECMFGEDDAVNKKKAKELADIKVSLASNYVGAKARVARIIAGLKKSEDFQKAGKNNDQREAWLALQLDSEPENDKLQEYNFYWGAIRTVEQYNNIFLALSGKMVLDERTEYISSKR